MLLRDSSRWCVSTVVQDGVVGLRGASSEGRCRSERRCRWWRMVRRGGILSAAHRSDWAAARGGLLIVLWALRGVTQVVLEILEGAYACGNLVVERADCIQ